MRTLSQKLRDDVTFMQKLMHGGKTGAMQNMLDAADALDLRPPMTWTDVPPASEGYYWILTNSTAQIEKISKINDKFCIARNPVNWVACDDIKTALWSDRAISTPCEP